MAEFIAINNATIVQGVTSDIGYLNCRLNNRNVGIPVFDFTSTTPNIELLNPTPGLILPESSTIYDAATAYGDVGVSLTINGSSYATPLYKIIQEQYVYPTVAFETPTLVSNLTSANIFMTIFIDNLNKKYYGVPLYTFGTLYQGTTSTAASALVVDTAIRTGKTLLDITDESGSTYLNPKLKAYSDLLTRIKRLLGWPSINLDLCDENISDFIDQAIEMFTKYAGYTEEYLVFNTDLYKHGYGIRLDAMFSTSPETSATGENKANGIIDYDLKDYRKVIDCWSFEQGEGTGINTLFTLEQAMAQQCYFSYMLGSQGFDLVTWDIMKGWLETRSKVLAQTPYFRFDPKTQIFRILPEPYAEQSYYGVIGCYVEYPIRHLINEPWVVQYALALTKITIGHIRGKFGGMVIFGGGQVNANDVLTQGITEKLKLEEDLQKGYGWADVAPTKFFMG